MFIWQVSSSLLLSEIDRSTGVSIRAQLIFRTALLEPELELKVVRSMKKPPIPPKPASFRSNKLNTRSTLAEINSNHGDVSLMDHDSNMNSLNTRRLGKIIKINLVKGKDIQDHCLGIAKIDSIVQETTVSASNWHLVTIRQVRPIRSMSRQSFSKAPPLKMDIYNGVIVSCRLIRSTSPRCPYKKRWLYYVIHVLVKPLNCASHGNEKDRCLKTW